MERRRQAGFLTVIGVLVFSLVMAQESKQPSKWKDLADIPVPQFACAAVLLNGKVHVLGGSTGPGSMMDAHQVYDPSTNTWVRKASLPEPRCWVMTALYKNKFYAFGGSRSGPAESATECADCAYYLGVDTAWMYDPQTDAWSELPKMPKPRTMGAAITVGDYIYIFGGNISRSDFNVTTYKYDPAAKTYTRMADMPAPARYLPRALYKGQIYTINCRDGHEGEAVQYDVARDRWQSLDVRLSLPRAAIIGQLSTHAVWEGTKLLVIGGTANGYAKRTAMVEYFDMETKTFGQLEPMPAPRCCGACAVVNGKLYVFGGHAQMPKDIEEVRAVWGYPF